MDFMFFGQAISYENPNISIDFTIITNFGKLGTVRSRRLINIFAFTKACQGHSLASSLFHNAIHAFDELDNDAAYYRFESSDHWSTSIAYELWKAGNAQLLKLYQWILSSVQCPKHATQVYFTIRFMHFKSHTMMPNITGSDQTISGHHL